MQFLLFFLVFGTTAAFVLSPFWMGAHSRTTRQKERFHALPQLELDRALGKIAGEEFAELKIRAEAEEKPVSRLEALIFRARRLKRLNLSLESEVLVARARRKK